MPWHTKNGGSYVRAQSKKGDLRCGSNSKNGGPRCGSGKKGGSLPRHMPILNIHVSAPPPPG